MRARGMCGFCSDCLVSRPRLAALVYEALYSPRSGRLDGCGSPSASADGVARVWGGSSDQGGGPGRNSIFAQPNGGPSERSRDITSPPRRINLRSHRLTAENGGMTTHRADLPIRLTAFLTDAALLGGGLAAIVLALSNHLSMNSRFGGSGVFWLCYAVFIGYSLTEVAVGVSPAKWIHGLRVLPNAPCPATMQRVRYGVRWCVKFLPANIIAIGMGMSFEGQRAVQVYMLTLFLPACSLLMLVCRSRWGTIHDGLSGLTLCACRSPQGFPVG